MPADQRTVPAGVVDSDGAPDMQGRITSYWDRYAADYDAHQRHRLALDGEREAWSRVWSTVLPPAPARVLDAGTGSGNVALQVAQLGHEVTGIDLSEGMLAEARAKAPSEDRRPSADDGPADPAESRPPTFLRGDAVDPPFPAGSFDAIVSRYLLWTLRDAADAFARLPLGRAGVERILVVLAAAGLEEVRADPLPEILALDRAHGVAPGHAPQMQYRFTGCRPL